MTIKYEELAQKLKKAMIWIDSPERTRDEIEKWMPTYILIFKQVTVMEREMRRNETQSTPTR